MSWAGFRELGIWSKPSGAPFLCIEPWRGYASPVSFDGEFGEKPGRLRYRQPGRADVREAIARRIDGAGVALGLPGAAAAVTGHLLAYVLIYFFAVVFTILVFTLGNQKKLVPTGMQNAAESAVELTPPTTPPALQQAAAR